MRICIVGAGAIGGLLGARLALCGEKVTLIARGEHLAAIRRSGLRLISGEEELVVEDLQATEALDRAGRHELVILALKAHQIEAVAPGLPALYGDDTVVLTVQNGIPWWYFQKHGGPLEGRRLESLDPHGTIEEHIPAQRILGGIAYPAAERVAPGVVRHIEDNRFPVGELDGSKSERARRIAEVLSRAGFKSRVVSDIRAQIWIKLWGNLSFNPISALTGATMVEIARFPETRRLVGRMMEEARLVAEKLGVRIPFTVEQRIAGAEAVGEHKTSMLQDLEAGRSLEVEALVGAVAELGRLTETPTPHIDAVYALVKLLDRTRGARAAG
ncbi:MAG: 2-dehydropantoate 2-reductase [Gemmatimonadales bacterium]|nr:MAG: 2-dehydropantoate 2-reductase [Gemmatimonadales bacterium]